MPLVQITLEDDNKDDRVVLYQHNEYKVSRNKNQR